LVLVGGLPGTGKSTLARGIAEEHGFTVIRSDAVRKEIGGRTIPSTAGFEEGLYTPDWTRRTYAECLRRAEGLCFEGQRIIVDATFRAEQERRIFLEAAIHWGVPGLMFVCRSDPEVVRQRLRDRRGDVSDADWAAYQQAAAEWEQLGPFVRRHVAEIDTGGAAAQALARAAGVLSACGLVVGGPK
jgi:hypothetical protein